VARVLEGEQTKDVARVLADTTKTFRFGLMLLKELDVPVEVLAMAANTRR
jgi:hypothetical protein